MSTHCPASAYVQCKDARRRRLLSDPGRGQNCKNTIEQIQPKSPHFLPQTSMDQPTIPPPSPWQQRTQALTHVLIHPTLTPSLHSQLLFSSLLPAAAPLRYFDYYPPLLSSSSSPLPLLQWSFSLFLRRLLCRYHSSWRSKCPYQQPPPVVVSSAVGPADWGPEARREHFRKRLRRGRLGLRVPTPVAIAVPDAALLLLLFWDPLWLRDT